MNGLRPGFRPRPSLPRSGCFGPSKQLRATTFGEGWVRGEAGNWLRQFVATASPWRLIPEHVAGGPPREWNTPPGRGVFSEAFGITRFAAGDGYSQEGGADALETSGEGYERLGLAAALEFDLALRVGLRSIVWGNWQ